MSEVPPAQKNPTPGAASPAAAGDWNVSLYEARHGFVWKYGADLVELLAPQAGEQILDLGCGTGHLTAQIAAAGAHVIGIDRSPDMIAQARRSYPGIQFEVADAREFDLGTQFDAVFSNAVLHWVRPPEEAVARIRAALRPGGRFVAEFGGRGNTRRMVSALESLAPELGFPGYRAPWFFPSLAEYAGLLEAQGLEVTWGTLYERPTPLDGEAGLRNWFEMFGGSLLDQVTPERRAACLATLESQLRPQLYRDGVWYADYRRLRFTASVVDGVTASPR